MLKIILLMYMSLLPTPLNSRYSGRRLQQHHHVLNINKLAPTAECICLLKLESNLRGFEVECAAGDAGH